MADKTFNTILPALKAVDNGDGTFSAAISIVGGAATFLESEDLTIAAGVVTATVSGLINVLTIDTSGPASEDVNTINGLVAGIYIVKAKHTARSVVCKNAADNLIQIADMTLSNTERSVTYLSDGTTLTEITRQSRAG